MASMPGTMGLGFAGFLALWTVMMAAMMFPSVAPAATLYVRVIRARAAGAVLTLRCTGFVLGYLATWATAGVLAFALAALAGKLAAHAPDIAPWVGAGLLALAGIYQLTPFKERCLAHCRSPLSLLLHFGTFRGRLRDVRVGLYHGGYCVGCCWGLMVVLIALGAMNLAVMAGLAAVILMEKTWSHGRRFGLAIGVALLGLALVVPSHPGLVPGLVSNSQQPMTNGMSRCSQQKDHGRRHLAC